MRKLLLLTGEISAYNVAVFNDIAKEFDLTVGYYSKDKSTSPCSFRKLKLKYKKFGSIVLIRGVNSLCNQYDVISVVPDFHVPSFSLLPFYVKRPKVVTWSIGFRCSYVHPYIVTRKHNFLDCLFLQVLKKADANIFYMEESKKFWNGSNLNMSKVFVAPNTTEVEPIEIKPEKKKKLIFVGTLYKGKGLDKLLDSVKYVIDKGNNNLHLTIVGDGECREELEDYVIKNGLSNYVSFVGAVFDEKILSEYFSEALMCISPTQAGLSVPKSMGYGVPFVTRRDAITGGEIYHITSGVNGYLYDNDEELPRIIEESCKNPLKFINMGLAAKDYYDHNATIAHMARGAIDAFNFVLNK